MERFGQLLSSAFAVNSVTIQGNTFGKIVQLTLLVYLISQGLFL